MNGYKNTLNHYTPYPLIIPGILKVGLGVTQTITAIAVSLFLSMPALCGHHKSEKFFVHSCKHIIHGTANILSGSIEAIPILGAILYGLRILNTYRNTNLEVYSFTSISTLTYHPNFKFYGYSEVPIYEFIKLQNDEMKNKTLKPNVKIEFDEIEH